MRCNHCNNIIDDGSLFCHYCGSRQDAPAQWQQPVQQEQQYWGNASVYQQPAYQENSYQQPAYQQNYYQQPAPNQKRYAAPAGKRSATAGVIAGVAVLLVLLVVVLGAFTNWFGLKGPLMTIASATRKTFAEGNFTVQFSAEVDYDSMEGVAYVDIDMKQETVNILMELEVDNEKGVLVIYDEYLILESDGDYEYTDISEQLDTFFDTYEKTGESELDWEDMLDEIDPYLYDEMEEYIDFDALNKCIETYAKQLNNAGWLKKNAGYSTQNKSGVKLHVLNPELDVFLSASVPFFETAVRNPDDYEELLDTMEDVEDVADEVEIWTVFGVKGGKLVSIEAELEVEGEEIVLEATFSDIGKTKLDLDELEDFLKDAKRNG